MRILLTNDDGFDAPGLIALYRAIADLGEVYVVAPATVQSATGHGVTFHRPIATHRVRVATNGQGSGELFEGFAVEGRPADCVKLAVAYLVPAPIDLVISGMNGGANIGVNVNYSGTVAAAREGAILGIPAIAVSLHIGNPQLTRWDAAATHARRVIAQLVAQSLLPGSLVNLNVPILDDGREPRGVKVVPISPSPLVDTYTSDDNADGKRMFRVTSSMAFRKQHPGTDVEALFERYITLTPMTLDSTHHAHMERLAHGVKFSARS